MSKQAMQAILDRACKDMRFNSRMINDPDQAMGEYDVTAEEQEALKSCRRDMLVAVGLDERMTAWIPWQWAPNRRQ
ncbi:MAG TPA: Os1348 family NHLP clan protein [Chloroflexota bacterium]|nr:Os1348 family NHLP clan protein [Chloroflexota bacterium]